MTDLLARLKAAQAKHAEAVQEILEIENEIKVQSRRLQECESPICDNVFLAKRNDQRFCNATCRSNARHYR